MLIVKYVGNHGYQITGRFNWNAVLMQQIATGTDQGGGWGS